jgi:hypothetical protein
MPPKNRCCNTIKPKAQEPAKLMSQCYGLTMLRADNLAVIVQIDLD